MFEAGRPKDDEARAERRNVAPPTYRREDPQGPAVRRLPVGVQIERERDLALLVALRLVGVPGKKGAGRISCVMQLEIEQAQQRLAIEREPQRLEAREQTLFRGKVRRREPADRITSDRVDAPHALRAADARRRELAARVALLGRDQEFASLGRREKIVVDAEALGADPGADAGGGGGRGIPPGTFSLRGQEPARATAAPCPWSCAWL